MHSLYLSTSKGQGKGPENGKAALERSRGQNDPERGMSLDYPEVHRRIAFGEKPIRKYIEVVLGFLKDCGTYHDFVQQLD